MDESCDDRIPLAYLITFRAYGTWLHGDVQSAMTRSLPLPVPYSSTHQDYSRFALIAGEGARDPNKTWSYKSAAADKDAREFV